MSARGGQKVVGVVDHLGALVPYLHLHLHQGGHLDVVLGGTLQARSREVYPLGTAGLRTATRERSHEPVGAPCAP